MKPLFCAAAFAAGLALAGAAHSQDLSKPGESIRAETLYQSRPDNMTALTRGERTILLLPNNAEMHNIDTADGYPHLYPGSCIAAPPARCQLRPGDVEPMRQVAPER